MAKNKVNISQKLIFFTILTQVGHHCGRFLGPLGTDLAKILCGEGVWVSQQMIGISLICVDVRGSNG